MRSYRTLSPLPRTGRGGLLSVALSLGFPASKSPGGCYPPPLFRGARTFLAVLANPAARRLLRLDTSRIQEWLPFLPQEPGSRNLTVDRDGETRTLQVTVAALSEASPGRVLTVRDITEEISVIQMKSRVLTIVSHEIRTPLTSLHGSLTLMDSGVVGDMNSDARTLVSIAQTSSERLMRLVNEYLDFERLNARSLKVGEFVDVDIAGVVDEAVRLMQPLAVNRMVRITHESAPIVVPMIRDRIVQVLSNLINNAVKFSGCDCIVHVEVDTTPDEVVVSVRDCGPGLNTSDIDRVFEPFFQSDDSAPGSGMGLAICRSIIAQHRGQIWAENLSSGGAAFHFTLPMSGVSLETSLAS